MIRQRATIFGDIPTPTHLRGTTGRHRAITAQRSSTGGNLVLAAAADSDRRQT